jgi:subfamily B ATP-binding cassette protein MsbA
MNSFSRIYQLIKSYKKLLALSIGSNILTALFTVISIPLVIPFFQILFGLESPVVQKPERLSDIAGQLKYLFSQLINNYDKETALLLVCGMIVAVFFLKNIFRYLALYFMAPLRTGVVRDLRNRLYKKYLDLPLAYYSNEKKGDLISRLGADVQEVEWSILHVVQVIFKAPLIIIGSILLMIYISPPLTIFVFVLLIFTALIIGTISRKLKKQSGEAQTMLGALISITEETIGSLRIIKGFNALIFQEDKFRAQNEEYRSKLTRIFWRKDLSSPLSEFLGITVVAVLLWYGSKLVFNSQLNPETFFAFIFAFYQVIEPSKSFSTAYYNIQKGTAALDRVEEVVNVDSAELDQKDAYSIQVFKDKIEISDLSFRYTEDDPWVLKNIDLEINKGEVIALVGASGSGKSTLIDLISRFYLPTDGKIKMDGKDISGAMILDYRRLIGLVTQDALLFHDTIKNNILFGAEFSQEKIENAARVANAHDFITQSPDGYDTIIGDKGMKLSGGQKQRLTLARAILRNPQILILDEATSALDAESESLVKQALDKVMQNRTVIVVAHRLSTIKNADKIVVLEDGRIVEIGNHESLMGAQGHYQKYADMQFF